MPPSRLHDLDPSSDVHEEVVRPEFKACRIAYERLNLGPCPAYVKTGHRVGELSLECLSGKSLIASPVSALAHPLFQVSQVEGRMVRGEPDQVVPVATFNSVLPTSKHERVHLPREEVGQRIRADRERNGAQQEVRLRVETRRGVGVNLDLDLDRKSVV